MKAIILAAGKGERLKDVESTVPKPMVKINGYPALEWTVRHMVSCGIPDIIITVGHLGRTIMEYFLNGSKFGARITYSIEEELLGTAGGLKQALPEDCKETVVVWNGDNFSNIDLTRMFHCHQVHKTDWTMAVIWRHEAHQSSIVGWDHTGKINYFQEKENRQCGWVSAGIHIIDPTVMNGFDGKGDIGRDLIPGLLSWNHHLTAYGLSHDETFRWYDTPKDLEELRKDYETH